MNAALNALTVLLDSRSWCRIPKTSRVFLPNCFAYGWPSLWGHRNDATSDMCSETDSNRNGEWINITALLILYLKQTVILRWTIQRVVLRQSFL